MFFAEAQIRVHLYGQPTDMRKSYDGLQALARHAMGRDPLDGALYVFVNRRGSQIKCLYFDRSGFCIWGRSLVRRASASPPKPIRTRCTWARRSRCPPRPSRNASRLPPIPGAPRNTTAPRASEELPFFDESKVPVQTLTLVHADVQGLSPDQYEVIGEKVTYRIAQRPGAYHVLKIRRPVIKIKSSAQILLSAGTGRAVLDGSRADVSFAAGLLMDKFAWHIPLYRQHQRLDAAGIRVSRPWLTQVAQAVISLLTPIYEAQLASIRSSRVKAMDETPIKAGRCGPRQDAHRLLLADLRAAR